MEKGPILFKYRPRPSLNIDAGPSNADDTYNFKVWWKLNPFLLSDKRTDDVCGKLRKPLLMYIHITCGVSGASRAGCKSVKV